MAQISLFQSTSDSRVRPLPKGSKGNVSVAIEEESFPFELLSAIGEAESWRKEINRPTYHIHKWWAQRLGSIFRSIIIACFAPKGASTWDLFYSPVRIPHAIVFDPFMGSGTTIGEVLKLGGRAIGRDINPVAYNLVRNAYTLPSLEELRRSFHAITKDVSAEIKKYYRAMSSDGEEGQALYYFWVKQIDCPNCSSSVDLFPSYIFSHHAYPRRFPEARAVCPSCGGINVARYNARAVSCKSCSTCYDPSRGPAHGAKADCERCKTTFKILSAVKQSSALPRHRLYAKLALFSENDKRYQAVDDFDLDLYEAASKDLAKRGECFPNVEIRPGYNTDQILKYGYRYWHQMFNDRQLLCLSILAERIRDIKNERERDIFCCLFSGMLEFNNMFASFKGEGTGAVRHLFSHHILKPEKTPLEANIWGTPKSSGSFSTLFESRIIRAREYGENPFELLPPSIENGNKATKKIYGLSAPLFHDPVRSYSKFCKGSSLYLSCGDSSHTDIVSNSIDAVITDPPFFDNVHYSELADFFHVWQQYILNFNHYADHGTTRSPAEVHHGDHVVFGERLAAIWKECRRVLKPTGLLVFTFHHSRNDGWRSLLASLSKAGFKVVRTHPIKAEMSVATPKRQANSPIDIDMAIVCRKRTVRVERIKHTGSEILRSAREDARKQLMRLNKAGRFGSRNDVRVILMAQLITRLSQLGNTQETLELFDSLESNAESLIGALYQEGLNYA